jgi:hypothetical protein
LTMKLESLVQGTFTMPPQISVADMWANFKM